MKAATIPTSLRAALVFGSLSAWLFISMGAKAQRYFIPMPKIETRVLDIITRELEPRGWKSLGQIKINHQSALEIYRFEHPDCNQPAFMAFLGMGDATVQMFYEALGSSIRFVYKGAEHDQPPVKIQQMHVLYKFIAHMLGLQNGETLPIIVLKRPPESAFCQLNLTQSWAEMERQLNIRPEMED